MTAANGAMTPLERARAGLDMTMSCAEGDAFLEQHAHCNGDVRWNGEIVGKCACPCHKEDTSVR